MDWIERLFGVSPDAGNGTLEGVYYAVAVLGVAALRFGAISVVGLALVDAESPE
jgi:hypothetical protein